jgi:TolB-like protein/DNA-binding winged helix-turn-helix (wHTH) protein/Tfp pilus assembly protein PilF
VRFLSTGLIQFGEFVLNCDRYELLRAGRPVKLEKIPMELLILLSTRGGRLVTRQEIIEHLWGGDVFLDTEHGINTAIRKIRFALKDDPERPRFVQTVTGKGYRFVTEQLNGNAVKHDTSNERASDSFPSKLSGSPANSRNHRAWWVVTLTAIVFIAAGAVVAFNAGGVRDRVFAGNPTSSIHSIAVLPLVNLSGDPTQDYFADGMTDEVITMLAKNTPLRVVSRTSAMQYKNVKKPLRDIGRDLGVDGILEGSVERSPNRVHITVQLIHASSDTHVWAESYDRDFNDAFSLPGELAQRIASEVKVAVGPPSRQRYINPEAHDEYLRGHYLWYSMDNENSRAHFEKAIQLQPDYVAAWSGLADTYIASVVEGLAPPDIAMKQGGEAARKAVELDDTVAEAHNSLAAFYLFGKWDWRSAEKESMRALALNPSLAGAHHLYSWVLVVSQRSEEAVREEKRAMDLDPFSEPWALGLTYIQVRQVDAAIRELEMRTTAQPNIVGFFSLSDAYRLKGKWKESQHNLEEGLRLANSPEVAAKAHRAFEAGGERAVEEWVVKGITARARREYVAPFDIASRYACLGDRENTLKYLEVALREHSAWLVFIQNEPGLDFLHSDKRYRTIVNTMGLPPAY